MSAPFQHTNFKVSIFLRPWKASTKDKCLWDETNTLYHRITAAYGYAAPNNQPKTMLIAITKVITDINLR